MTATLAAIAMTGPVAALAQAASLPLINIESGQSETFQVEPHGFVMRQGGEMVCFRTPLSIALMTETYKVYDHPAPAASPADPDCFDAGAIAQDLHDGIAVAFLSQNDVTSGIDRVVAVYPDGRAYAWRQPSDAGK